MASDRLPSLCHFAKWYLLPLQGKETNYIFCNECFRVPQKKNKSYIELLLYLSEIIHTKALADMMMYF